MPAPGFHEKGLEVALDIEQLLYEGTFRPIGTPNCSIAERFHQRGFLLQRKFAPDRSCTPSDVYPTIGRCPPPLRRGSSPVSKRCALSRDETAFVSRCSSRISCYGRNAIAWCGNRTEMLAEFTEPRKPDACGRQPRNPLPTSSRPAAIPRIARRAVPGIGRREAARVDAE
jgi:hypothetical protein